MAASSLIDATDEQLLARAVGEPEAFGVFYDRYERGILAFFSRATGQPDAAAYLTAEVFAAALVGPSSFRPELGRAQGWLCGIARHQLADAWEHGRVEDRARRRLGIASFGLRDELLERIDELGARCYRPTGHSTAARRLGQKPCGPCSDP